MTRLSEKRDVQDGLVNHLTGIGWEYLPPDEGLPLDCRGDDSWTTSRVRVEVQGDIYSAHLNSILVLRVQDDTFSTGRVGLGTTRSSENVRSDNFAVAPIP